MKQLTHKILAGRKEQKEEDPPKSNYLDQIILCNCGVLLPTLEGYEGHERLGHFDLPDYELSQDEKNEIIRIVRQHGRLALGRSAGGREVYYFCFADREPPRIPTLHWNDDPNVASAFAKMAHVYAAKVRDATDCLEREAVRDLADAD